MAYKDDYEWIEHCLTIMKLIDDMIVNTADNMTSAHLQLSKRSMATALTSAVSLLQHPEVDNVQKS